MDRWVWVSESVPTPSQNFVSKLRGDAPINVSATISSSAVYQKQVYVASNRGVTLGLSLMNENNYKVRSEA